VVLVGDAARDGEAEAVAGFAGVESDEAFEDAFALMFGHAGPVVCDARLDVSVDASQLHVDSTGGLDGVEGVVDQVAEEAFERIGIAAHRDVVVRAECDGRVRRAYMCLLDQWACDLRRSSRNSKRSSLVTPSRLPASTPACRTHSRSDSEETPRSDAISFSERPRIPYIFHWLVPGLTGKAHVVRL
jgi:hypothetical protein